MDTCIVRQPMIDRNNKVAAYEILYKEDESSFYNRHDARVANAIEQFMLELDDKFLSGKAAFLTFTPNLLLKDIPRIFSENKLVIQIEDNVLINPQTQDIIYRYRDQGYRIAVKGFEFSPRYFEIMGSVDFIKLDIENEEESALRSVIEIAHSLKKSVIAYNINTVKQLELARELKCDLVQGPFIAELKTPKTHKLEHMQSNFFQLMVAVIKNEPDIEEITEIISRDVTLAYSLLKLVNSAYFALRNRAKSVQQALVILGIGQLKQWIYLLSFKRDNGGMSDELIKISFLRAKFCEELSKKVASFPIKPAEAYMMGMFSTLGTLMEVPLEIALHEMPISNEVKDALITGEGRCGELYNLVLCYENADWIKMSDYAYDLSVPVDIIAQAYFQCIEYVNEIWEALNKASGDENTI